MSVFLCRDDPDYQMNLAVQILAIWHINFSDFHCTTISKPTIINFCAYAIWHINFSDFRNYCAIIVKSTIILRVQILAICHINFSDLFLIENR